MNKTINKKILIVDDDKDFLSILKLSLEGESFSIVSAKNGEEGLKMTSEEKPDLILLDVMMPEMDGMEMAKRLRDAGDATPIIFLTNVEDMSNISEAFKEPGTDYIIKATVHIKDIIEAIKNKLKL